jgi:hypothetical protein
MRRVRRRCALLTTFLSLIAAPAAAHAAAAAPPVLGAADGVQATLDGQTLEVRFSAEALGKAKVAGEPVTVTCGAHPQGRLAFTASVADDSESGRAGADGTIRVTLKAHGATDACEIERFAASGDAITVARVALTPAGETFLDEQRRTEPVFALLRSARGASGYRSADEVAAAGGGTITALADAAATPPADQVGYWTDGGRHAVLSTLSAGGRRLVVEDLGNAMVRTNVFELFGQDVLRRALDVVTSGGSGPPSDKDPGAPRYTARSPVTERDGVRAHLTGRRLVLRFGGASARAFRAIAGRRVSVTCLPWPAPSITVAFPDPAAVSTTVVRVPPHGGVLAVTLARPGDICAVTDDDRFVVNVTPTARGRRTRADGNAVALLTNVKPDALAAAGATSYPSSAVLVARSAAAVKAKARRLVALPTAGASAPVGRVGVWTDGAQQALLATTTRYGHRLVVADEGAGMVRTNILGSFAILFLVGTTSGGTTPQSRTTAP